MNKVVDTHGNSDIVMCSVVTNTSGRVNANLGTVDARGFPCRAALSPEER